MFIVVVILVVIVVVIVIVVRTVQMKILSKPTDSPLSPSFHFHPIYSSDEREEWDGQNLTNQPINQPTNQPANQLTNKPANR